MARVCFSCMLTVENDDLQICPHCHNKVAYESKDAIDYPAGETLHRQYLIGRSLGRGGNGVTYIAKDNYTNERCAIKECFPRNACTRRPGEKNVMLFSPGLQPQMQRARENFKREIDVLKKIQKTDFAVAYKDSFDEYGTTYLVMEYANLTLSRYIELHNGRLEPEDAAYMLVSLLRTVQKLHSFEFPYEGKISTLLHRDISSDNICIDENGKAGRGFRLRLIDFGSAQPIAAQDNGGKLLFSKKKGYSSPEQVANEYQDQRSDLYSVGVVFFKMLCGHTPEEDEQTRVLHPLTLPPSVTGVPAWMHEVLAKATQPNPDDRYQNAQEFLDDIAAKGGKHYLSTGGLSPAQRKLVIILSATLLPILLIVVLVILLSRPVPPAPPRPMDTTAPAVTDAPTPIVTDEPTPEPAPSPIATPEPTVEPTPVPTPAVNVFMIGEGDRPIYPDTRVPVSVAMTYLPEDARVELQLLDAQKRAVDADGRLYPLAQDADGLWTTAELLAPEIPGAYFLRLYINQAPIGEDQPMTVIPPEPVLERVTLDQETKTPGQETVISASIGQVYDRAVECAVEHGEEKYVYPLTRDDDGNLRTAFNAPGEPGEYTVRLLVGGQELASLPLTVVPLVTGELIGPEEMGTVEAGTAVPVKARLQHMDGHEAAAELLDEAGTVVGQTPLAAGEDDTWTGELTPPGAGVYSVRLSVDGEPLDGAELWTLTAVRPELEAAVTLSMPPDGLYPGKQVVVHAKVTGLDGRTLVGAVLNEAGTQVAPFALRETADGWRGAFVATAAGQYTVILRVDGAPVKGSEAPFTVQEKAAPQAAVDRFALVDGRTEYQTGEAVRVELVLRGMTQRELWYEIYAVNPETGASGEEPLERRMLERNTDAPLSASEPEPYVFTRPGVYRLVAVVDGEACAELRVTVTGQEATEAPEPTAEPDTTEESEPTEAPGTIEQPELTAEPGTTEESEPTEVPTEEPEPTEAPDTIEQPEPTPALRPEVASMSVGAEGETALPREALRVAVGLTGAYDGEIVCVLADESGTELDRVPLTPAEDGPWTASLTAPEQAGVYSVTLWADGEALPNAQARLTVSEPAPELVVEIGTEDGRTDYLLDEEIHIFVRLSDTERHSIQYFVYELLPDGGLGAIKALRELAQDQDSPVWKDILLADVALREPGDYQFIFTVDGEDVVDHDLTLHVTRPVPPSIVEITGMEEQMSLLTGQTAEITVAMSGEPLHGQDFTFELTGGQGIVDVTREGNTLRAQALRPGAATLTVRDGLENSYSCRFTVQPLVTGLSRGGESVAEIDPLYIGVAQELTIDTAIPDAEIPSFSVEPAVEGLSVTKRGNILTFRAEQALDQPVTLRFGGDTVTLRVNAVGVSLEAAAFDRTEALVGQPVTLTIAMNREDFTLDDYTLVWKAGEELVDLRMVDVTTYELMPRAMGDVVLQVTDHFGYQKTLALTIVPQVKGFNAQELFLYVGHPGELELQLTDASQIPTAAVAQEGLPLTVAQEGTVVTLTATAEMDETVTFRFDEEAYDVHVQAVYPSLVGRLMPADQATLYPEDVAEFTFSMDAPDVRAGEDYTVTIAPEGVVELNAEDPLRLRVTAVRPGTATVTVAAERGEPRTLTIDVAARALGFETESVSLLVGQAPQVIHMNTVPGKILPKQIRVEGSDHLKWEWSADYVLLSADDIVKDGQLTAWIDGEAHVLKVTARRPSLVMSSALQPVDGAQTVMHIGESGLWRFEMETDEFQPERDFFVSIEPEGVVSVDTDDQRRLVVKAQAVGDAVVTVSDSNGNALPLAIQVQPRAKGLERSEVSLVVGRPQTINMQVADGEAMPTLDSLTKPDGVTAQWNNGQLTLTATKAVQDAEVVLTLEGKAYPVKVSAAWPSLSGSLIPKTGTLFLDQTQSFSFRMTPSGFTEEEYEITSSNPSALSVAKTGQPGVFTATARRFAENVTVTVTDRNGDSQSATVSVIPRVSGLDQDALELSVGQTARVRVNLAAGATVPKGLKAENASNIDITMQDGVLSITPKTEMVNRALRILFEGKAYVVNVTAAYPRLVQGRMTVSQRAVWAGDTTVLHIAMTREFNESSYTVEPVEYNGVKATVRKQGENVYITPNAAGRYGVRLSDGHGTEYTWEASVKARVSGFTNASVTSRIGKGVNIMLLLNGNLTVAPALEAGRVGSGAWTAASGGAVSLAAVTVRQNGTRLEITPRQEGTYQLQLKFEGVVYDLTVVGQDAHLQDVSVSKQALFCGETADLSLSFSLTPEAKDYQLSIEPAQGLRYEKISDTEYRLTAEKLGEYKIKVTDRHGASRSQTLRVNQRVTGFKQDSVTLRRGETARVPLALAAGAKASDLEEDVARTVLSGIEGVSLDPRTGELLLKTDSYAEGTLYIWFSDEGANVETGANGHALRVSTVNEMTSARLIVGGKSYDAGSKVTLSTAQLGDVTLRVNTLSGDQTGISVSANQNATVTGDQMQTWQIAWPGWPDNGVSTITVTDTTGHKATFTLRWINTISGNVTAVTANMNETARELTFSTPTNTLDGITCRVVSGAGVIDLPGIAAQREATRAAGKPTIRFAPRSPGEAVLEISDGENTRQVKVTVLQYMESVSPSQPQVVEVGKTLTLDVSFVKGLGSLDTVTVMISPSNLFEVVQKSGSRLTVKALSIGDATITLTGRAHDEKQVQLKAVHISRLTGAISWTNAGGGSILEADGTVHVQVGGLINVTAGFEEFEYNAMNATVSGNLFSKIETRGDTVLLKANRAASPGQTVTLTVEDDEHKKVSLTLSTFDAQHESDIGAAVQALLTSAGIKGVFPTKTMDSTTQTKFADWAKAHGYSMGNVYTLREKDWAALQPKVTPTPKAAATPDPNKFTGTAKQRGGLNTVAYGTDSRMYMVDETGWLHRIDPATGEIEESLLGGQRAKFVSVFGEGGVITAVDSKGGVYVWDRSHAAFETYAMKGMMETVYTERLASVAAAGKAAIGVTAEATSWDVNLSNKKSTEFSAEAGAAVFFSEGVGTVLRKSMTATTNVLDGVQAVAAYDGTVALARPEGKQVRLYFYGAATALTKKLLGTSAMKNPQMVQANGLGGSGAAQISMTEDTIAVLLKDGTVKVADTGSQTMRPDAKKSEVWADSGRTNITAIAIADNTLYMLAKGHKLYSVGKNATKAISGVRSIATNGSRLLVVTQDDQVFTLGANRSATVALKLTQD